MKTTSPQAPQELQPLGTKKTLLIMVTVVGCVAILWPKVFYPMITGNPQKPAPLKDYRGPGCCDVVLDSQEFANSSTALANLSLLERKTFRKHLNVYTGEISIRQERPPHLKPDGIHPAMRERGRAVPMMPSIPITGDRPRISQIPPKIVDGKPGPIPGMRPPMGAGSHQQPATRTNSMGLIMPLYTVGIVAFFVYTIMKIICKKSPATPYTEVKPDPQFRQQVFETDQQPYIKRPDDGSTKLAWKDHDAIVAAIQGIIEAADQHIQSHRVEELDQTTTDLSKDTTNEKADLVHDDERVEEIKEDESSRKGKIEEVEIEREELDPIILDTLVSPESQILVADTDTIATEVNDEAFSGSADDPAVVLSGRMTLSLINPHIPEYKQPAQLKRKEPVNGKEDLEIEVSNVVLMEKMVEN